MSRIGKNKPGMIIVFSALIIILGFVVYAIVTLYVDLDKEIVLYKNSHRVKTPGMVSEYENNVCWIFGVLKADDPDKLLVSPGAGIVCIYYHYTVEYALYETDSDGDVHKKWHTSTDEEVFSEIPLSVVDKEYRLKTDRMKFERLQEKTVDRKEKVSGTEYRLSEYIIRDGTEVWVFGSPEKDTIRPSEAGLIIITGTPDKYISDSVCVLTGFMVMIMVLLFLIGILILVVVRMVIK
jgi:hypothetical protein